MSGLRIVSKIYLLPFDESETISHPENPDSDNGHEWAAHCKQDLLASI